MCGRFTMTLTFQQVAEIINIAEQIDLQPKYNIAPMQQVPVVINDIIKSGENENTPAKAQKSLKLFKWGLIPYWAKDISIGNKMINARAETIDTKPSFRHCLPKQRCLILADGFYEWKREEKRKTPYRFTLTDRKLFGFAGIWDAWNSPTGDIIHTCAIITSEPNEIMAPIHNRMPVILEQEKEEMWLNPEVKDSNILKQLLTPYPADLMNFYEVSPIVNSSRYDTPECIQPADKQVSLF